MTNFARAGVLLFIAGTLIFMGITTAEAFFPAGYSTADNEISDLGSGRSAGDVAYQPSTLIFNVSMELAGLLVIAAVVFLYRAKTTRLLTVPLGLFGIGVLGVGLFPGGTPLHPFFATLTFVSGGVAAISSARFAKGLFRYPAAVLGVIALTFLVLRGVFIPHLGVGGAERWVAYPITLWLVGLGGYLLGSTSAKK